MTNQTEVKGNTVLWMLLGALAGGGAVALLILAGVRIPFWLAIVVGLAVGLFVRLIREQTSKDAAPQVQQPLPYPQPVYSVQQPYQQPVENTKKCPYCAETVLAEAIKCKHCGSELGGNQ